jgi:hypothetical protein
VGGTILGPGPGRGQVHERDQARQMGHGPGQFPDGKMFLGLHFLFLVRIMQLISNLYYTMKINIFGLIFYQHATFEINLK